MFQKLFNLNSPNIGYFILYYMQFTKRYFYQNKKRKLNKDNI